MTRTPALADLTSRLDVLALFAPAAGARRVLLAVSGGPDSLALLHLAVRWRDQGGPPLHAVTVDHGLRAESRAEAEWVAGWVAALDVPHTICTWLGEKPQSRLQERARDERYRLIGNLARDIDADVLMTGHHGDDQAETILFRLLRGSGIGGLAGMARVSQRDGLRLVRPLLDFAKADLIGICETAGQPFFRDPSNENSRFARTRLRQLTALLEAEGLGADAWRRLGRRAARAEAAIRAGVNDAREGLLRQPGADLSAERFEAPGAYLAALPEEILLRILEGEIARIGGAPPRLDQLETLTTRVNAAVGQTGAMRMTLAGALVTLSQKGRFSITKAPPRRGPVRGPDD